MPYSELPAFMKELRAVEGVAARALEFVIFTAAGSSEVIGARWSEFDLEAREWTVPPQRMKARKEHVVPLSARAVTLLKALPRKGDDFVFSGVKAGKPIGDYALARVLKTLRPDATVHGMRASFRDWREERSAFPPIVFELSLAHRVGDATVQAYRRTDLIAKRAKLMTAWSDYCGAPVGVTNAVPLQRRSN